MNLKSLLVGLIALGSVTVAPGHAQVQPGVPDSGTVPLRGTGIAGSHQRRPALHRLNLQFPLLDHPVYHFLDRLETTGEIPLLSHTRPYVGLKRHPLRIDGSATQHSEVQRYLAEGWANMEAANARVESGDTRYTGWRWLRNRLGLTAGQQSWFYGDGYHLARGSIDTTFTVTLQPVYGLDLMDTDDERGRISRFTSGLRVEGGYAGRLHYVMDFRDHTESGNGPYDTRAKLYEDRWAAVGLAPDRMSTSYDISESFLQYYGRDLSATVGRGRHRWGPAHSGSLFLNSRMPPFDYARFDAAIESQQSARAVYYTFLHGWLQSQVVADTLYIGPTGRPRTLNAQKFLSAQRLEVRPRANLLLAFSQGVVYGDRGVQLGYLTPLNFLYSVQHSNDDKDNMVLSFDGTWRPERGVKLYGELFLDDVVVSELLTSSGNNKSAFTLGTEFARQVSRRGSLDLWLEYTRIRPFVYSHVFAANVYTHWTSPIGYSLEPNSEYVSAELRGAYYPFALTLSLRHGNHGANTAERNVGGDIAKPKPDLEKAQDYPLLGGHMERTLQRSVMLDCEALPGLRLYVQAMAITASGKADRLEWLAGFGWNL